MIELSDKSECSGCGACAAVCPKNAIQMKADEAGFLVPVIDNKMCVECRKCISSCPILSDNKHNTGRLDNPKVYAVKNTQKSELIQSASGGAFSLLAKRILSENGVIFGAVWDSEFNAVFSSANSADEIVPMRGSKYVQSNASKAYPMVKEALKEGRKVLFTGLPCQVGGLYAFLKNVDCSNLITADIVCHGGGSPKMLRESVHFNEKKHQKKILALNQTDKSREWNIMIQKTIKMGFDDESCILLDSSEDVYLSLFLNGYIYREACYKCRFAKMPRQADITLGDLFGFGVIQKRMMDPSGGISLVMANTIKGVSLIDQAIQEYQPIYEEITVTECAVFNHNLWKPSHKPKERDSLVQAYCENGFEVLQQFYNSPKRKINRRGRTWIKKMIGKRNTCRLMYYCNRNSWEKYKRNQEITKHVL